MFIPVLGKPGKPLFSGRIMLPFPWKALKFPSESFLIREFHNFRRSTIGKLSFRLKRAPGEQKCRRVQWKLQNKIDIRPYRNDTNKRLISHPFLFSGKGWTRTTWPADFRVGLDLIIQKQRIFKNKNSIEIFSINFFLLFLLNINTWKLIGIQNKSTRKFIEKKYEIFSTEHEGRVPYLLVIKCRR